MTATAAETKTERKRAESRNKHMSASARGKEAKGKENMKQKERKNDGNVEVRWIFQMDIQQYALVFGIYSMFTFKKEVKQIFGDAEHIEAVQCQQHTGGSDENETKERSNTRSHD